MSEKRTVIGYIYEPIHNRIKSGTFSVLIANIINKAVGMLSSMIITRIVPTDDYGVWSYTLNIYSYLLLISGLGLATGAMQFGTENQGDKKAGIFFKYCIKTGTIIDFIIITVFGLIMIKAVLPIPRAKHYIIAILPMLLIEYIMSIAQAMLRSQNRIREYARALNINAILLTVGNFAGAFVGINGMLAGRYLADIVSFGFISHYLFKDYKSVLKAGKLETKEKKELWRYSLYTGASAAMNMLVYSLDITLIATLIKKESEIAIYRIGTIIPNTLYFIPNSIIVAILPNLIYHRKDIDWIKNEVRKVVMPLGGFNILMCSILILLAPHVISFFASSKYLASVPVLKVLTIGYLVSGTFRSLSVNILASLRRVKFGLLISVTSCILDVLLNILLITEMGSIGAAYATLVVDIVTAAMSFGYLLYLIKKRTLTDYVMNDFLECNR